MDRKMSEQEVARFKQLAGVLNEWHPDKEWDEEDDQEETGEDSPSDEDLFGMSESHPGNEQWIEAFRDALGFDDSTPTNLKNSLYTDQHYLIDKYGHLSPEKAAEEWLKDNTDEHDYEPDTDADYEEPRDDFDMAGDFNDGEFWESEIKRFQEIAGVSQPSEGPEDDDEEEREAKAKKAEMDAEEAENAERDLDEDAYDESGDTSSMNIAEVEGGLKFKVGDVVNSRVNKGNKLVVLMAFPNLEAAMKYDDRDEPTFWEKAIIDGDMGPVSDDIENKPWYLTWTREVKGEDLVTCDPEEFLSK